MVIRGAISSRETLRGLSICMSERCTAPTKLSREKYNGTRRQGDCSTLPKRASGTLRSVTLVAGIAGVVEVAATGSVRKLLSFNPAKFRLKPRKLLVKKMAL